MLFDDFFGRATEGLVPFDYQRRLACGERGSRTKEDWLAGGAQGRSLLVNVPTGCGKTAAVVLAWLWNRVLLQRPDWPRRLVYCLPMRTLVEQTRENVGHWLQALAHAHPPVGHSKPEDLEWLAANSPVVLMGGEEPDPGQEEWDLWPEKPAILIGTQDMLLSRALNRGYGMSRYRWPMHFGLLNNDCLWVFDEVQLMGAGMATTAQLEAFRNLMSPERACHSIWMSATLRAEWLCTVDFDPEVLEAPVSLSDDEKTRGILGTRYSAPKSVAQFQSPGWPDSPGRLAERISAEAIDAEGLTLVVLNTVGRAQALHDELDRLRRKRNSDLPLTLIHSRFRPKERNERVRELLTAEGKPGIVVSTQVVEAGVDVSAALLFTELAPWTSLVQRFGRANRRGTEVNARILWINLKDEREAAPYEPDQLERARARLERLNDASLANLEAVRPGIEDRPQSSHVLRRKDIVDLFDTTPDLAGNDIDIDRYVREVDDSSVQVFWREWEGTTPPKDTGRPRREELCPAPIEAFRELVKAVTALGAWRWDHLEREWTSVERPFPGQVYLLHAKAGGYSVRIGWQAKSRDPVKVIESPSAAVPPEANDDDRLSRIGIWQSIAQHTDDVCRELAEILVSLKSHQAPALQLAARWHDRGKAHPTFQGAVRDAVDGTGRPADWRDRRDIAKAPHGDQESASRGWWHPKYDRKHFRHELASALTILDPSTALPDELRDLVAYLAAAHHGKVRLSIRSLPGERRPETGGRFARGVWDNDMLPEVNLGADLTAPAVRLSLEPMEIGLCEQQPFAGEPSWADRVLHLRDTLGPFRLAFLETLICAADRRASAKAVANRMPAREI